MRESRTPVQDQVMEVIGVEAFDLLTAALGGSRIVVPKSIGEHHPIAQAIGLELAQKLSAERPALTIDLPVTPKKRALIETALSDRLPAAHIARRYFCSVRFVYKVQAEMRDRERLPDEQMGLF